MFDSIGFVGGGRVTRFLLEGWRRANRLPGRVRVSDASAEVRFRLTADFPGIEATDNVGAAIVAAYRAKLPSLYAKISP